MMLRLFKTSFMHMYVLQPLIMLMFAQSTPTKKVRVSVEDLENVNPVEMHQERHVQSAEAELKRKNPGLRSLGFGVGKLLSFSPHKKLRDVTHGASFDFKARHIGA